MSRCGIAQSILEHVHQARHAVVAAGLATALLRITRAIAGGIHIAQKLLVALAARGAGGQARVVTRARGAKVCPVETLRNAAISAPGIAHPARAPGGALRVCRGSCCQTD